LPYATQKDLVQLLGQVLGAAMELLEADKGAIHLYDPADRKLIIVAQQGADERFLLSIRSGTADSSVRCVTLLDSDGRSLGLLSIGRVHQARLSARELKLLDLFSRQAEQVIESKRAEQDLRRNEARLLLALDAGEMGSWEWNIRTGEIRWSENLEAIHGLEPGSFAGTFEAYQATIHPDDRESVLTAIRRSVETRSDYEAEFRSASSSGNVRWMHGKGKVLTDEHGVPSRMIGVCTDVTKRKRAEQAILEADRRKDEFLAMISHELRNPLSAITNAAALLEHAPAREGVSSKTLAVIRRQTEQLTRIVDDLLDISRLNAGKLALKRTELDLASLVERCVKELAARRLFERHRLDLEARSALVDGDGARLEQVVTNLVTNALKYTPEGGAVGVVVEPDGADAVLRVRDTGIGIAPEFLPRIFGLFVQSERGLYRRDGGLGVGLSIVRQLVEAHGGRVSAESAGPGCGAEFTVRLPRVTAVDAKGAYAGDDAGSPARRSILVVDDNDDARESLVDLLKLAGHDVYEAGDGPSGLEVASRARPDAVLVDIGLPGFDGFELARRLRAGGSTQYLVALTGYGHPDHRRLGVEAGFDAYLVKPVKLDAVLDSLGARNTRGPKLTRAAMEPSSNDELLHSRTA
jgi:PAS domain S-box-containing protein